MQFLIDLFLHLDTVLASWTAMYGLWIYAMLFLIIFCETGLVVTPFLPGDSLLFTAGAIAAVGGGLDVWIVLVILIVAATLGDNVNYSIGRRFGRGLIDSGRIARVVKPEYIQRTDAFFEVHGGKTITLARFFPIIRTIAPFLAGIGEMHWRRFMAFNFVGAVVWVSAFVFVGFFFGTIPIVRDHLSLMALGIVSLTLIPIIIHMVRSRWHG